MEKGKAEGLAEGKSKAILEPAKKLKAAGVSSEIIKQATGLSLEEIEKLH